MLAWSRRHRGRVHRVDDSICKSLRADPIDVGHHERELIAAVASHEVLRAGGGLHDPRAQLEDQVAVLMT